MSSNISGSSSRPGTPPSLTRQKSTPPLPLAKSTSSPPPPRKTYTGFLSQTNDAWNDSVGEDGEDGGVDFGLDDEEDEFGLPSIASMRRKGKRSATRKEIDPGGGGSSSRGGGGGTSGARLGAFGGGYGADVGAGDKGKDGLHSKYGSAASGGGNGTGLVASTLSSWSLDNGDLAEERAIPTYPTAKRTEGKILRPQYRDILRDPANSLHLISHSPLLPGASAKEAEAHSARISRINKFKKILQASAISVSELRDSAWSGLPPEVRAMSWQLLLSYLPTSSERRVATLERKRKEYLEGVRLAFDRGTTGSDKPADAGLSGTPGSLAPNKSRGRGLDEVIWHQISIDVPRTNPHLPLYAYEATQRSLERILYVWAIRHPASGYVQGINDLVTPFWQVFLGQYMTDPDVEFGMDPGQLPKSVLDAVEADSFWCLTKLLDGIQDNYIHAQPGIQRQVAALRDLTARIDATLAKHMEQEGVEFIQFSFRWMNCLLMREISVKNTIRMWDTYLAESNGFSEFHLYVCAAFLVKWSDKLCKMDFQEIMMFLQSLPTKQWTEKDIELLLSEAYIWQTLFKGSKAHVRQSSKDQLPGVVNL
ncbi:RabGAP/TBC [Polychaeton citri CBS 116435]|uniref:RabGAP/TBC n=1 Tax=Polychaeton citri CBS 116435 TaxID=1314669 RepID=A0A9P4URU5_9PEZI|nr:RabGAP/TBC [Polychaeton citri CBS 116435]